MPPRRRLGGTLTRANLGAVSDDDRFPVASPSSFLSRSQPASPEPQSHPSSTFDASAGLYDLERCSPEGSPAPTMVPSSSAEKSSRNSAGLRMGAEPGEYCPLEASFVRLLVDLVGEPSEDFGDIVLPVIWGQEESMRDVLAKMEHAEIVPARRWIVVNGSQPVPGSHWTSKRPDVVLLGQFGHRSAGSADFAIAGQDLNPAEDIHNRWKPNSTTSDKRRWTSVVVVGHLEHGEGHSGLVEQARGDTYNSLREMVSSTGRTAGFGFSLVNNELQVYLATPSGVFESPVVDCDQDRSAPLRLLRSFAAMNDASLGSFTGLSSPPNSTHPPRFPSTCLPPLSSAFHPAFESTFDLDLLTTSFPRDSITGRCTNVTNVRIATANPSLELDGVMKSSYAESDGANVEEEIWARLAELPAGDASNLPRAYALFRGPAVAGFGPYSTPRFVPRQHQVVLLTKAYRSLWTARSTKELCSGVLDAIKGHKQLFDLGYFHCDVSDGNVMLGSDGGGYLINFDSATPVDKVESTTQSRMGTLTFVARGLLCESPEQHAARHDLESFLYVVFFITLQSVPTLRQLPDARPAPTDRGAETIQEWNGTSSTGPLAHKATLVFPLIFERLIEDVLSEWGEPMKHFLRAFGEEVGLNQQARFIDSSPSANKATHEAIWARLQPMVERM